MHLHFIKAEYAKGCSQSKSLAIAFASFKGKNWATFTKFNELPIKINFQSLMQLSEKKKDNINN